MRAYIGSFTAAGGRGITTAAVAPDTGALTVLHSTDAVTNPSYLALSPDRTVLYAVSENDEGAVAALRVAGERPEPAGAPVPVQGAGPTHLSFAAGHVLTANYGSGSVTTVPVAPDGSLTPAPHVLQYHGSGPHPERQQGPHAHQVLPDPGGRWILGVDLGTDSVRVCALDPSQGELRVHTETALRPGSGPRHLTFHPDGRHVYVVNELDPTLTVCRWDAEKGRLEPLGETRLLDDGTTGHGSEVVVAPDGRFLWVATRGSDLISVLALDSSGETARLVTTVPCGGHWPRDLALGPDGRHLYAANERSGDVTWFAVDAETGIPHRAGSVPAPAASCVIFG